MSVKIDKDSCTGCKGQESPYCVEQCPGNLLALDEKTSKVYIRNDRDCWDCMVCVKVCPFQAIETRLSYQLASYKARLVPVVHSKKIIWKLEDINGCEEIFEIPVTEKKKELNKDKEIDKEDKKQIADIEEKVI